MSNTGHPATLPARIIAEHFEHAAQHFSRRRLPVSNRSCTNSGYANVILPNPANAQDPSSTIPAPYAAAYSRSALVPDNTMFTCENFFCKDPVIAAIRSAALEPIQWSVDSGDRTASSADEICERVAAETEPGAILLFHNAGPCTLEALPTVLEFLLSDGYQVLPVSQLLLQGDCVVDSSG